MKVRVLDVFCGAGGCSVGYYGAFSSRGYECEVVGWDKEAMQDYPYIFCRGDAMEVLADVNYVRSFDFVHTSPPCPFYSNATPVGVKASHPDLVGPVRELLIAASVPSVIENVMPSPVRPDIVLSGAMFGLKVVRRRKFETVNWFTLATGAVPINGTARKGDYITVAGNGSKVNADHKSRDWAQPYKHWKGSVIESWSDAMGIHWMKSRKALANAIPPAYTHYIGELFIDNFFDKRL